MNTRRPVPADFVQHMNETNAQLEMRYSVGSSTLYLWFAELGEQGIHRAERPNASLQYLDAIKAGIDAGKTSAQVAAELGLKQSTVLMYGRRHKLGAWKMAPVNKPGLTIPPEFAEFYTAHTRAETAARFGIAVRTVGKWSGLLGLTKRTPRAVAKPAPKPAHSGRVFVSTFTQTGPVDRSYKEDSRAGEAARYLQPDYIPTYRCRADGVQDTAGKFWRCGRRILTDAEIIAKADEVRARNERRRAA